MSMPDLPGGIYTVLAVCGVGLSLVLFFAVKEYCFNFHRRRGVELMGERNYQAAMSHLVRAEKLWMLRLSKQTMISRAEDCERLGIVLDLLAEAARHCSITVDLYEYRQAVREMEQFFSSTDVQTRKYPQIYARFVDQRKRFRMVLRGQ